MRKFLAIAGLLIPYPVPALSYAQIKENEALADVKIPPKGKAAWANIVRAIF